VGSSLTANPGSWSDPAATFSYAWLRCDSNGACTAIEGAVDSTYTLTTDDLGYSVGVEVTASGAGGTGMADSNLVGPVVLEAPVVITAPALTGEATVGSVLTADPGTWSDPAATFSYAWLRCDSNGACTAIDGALGLTYLLIGDDLGYSIRLEVIASNAAGNARAESAPTTPVGPQDPGDAKAVPGDLRIAPSGAAGR
jgi:hypothetical protein